MNRCIALAGDPANFQYPIPSTPMSINNSDDGTGTAETTGVDGGLLTVGYAVSPSELGFETIGDGNLRNY